MQTQAAILLYSQKTSVINSQIFTVLTKSQKRRRLLKECLKTTQMMTLLVITTTNAVMGSLHQLFQSAQKDFSR